jgi:hypothetical protein
VRSTYFSKYNNLETGTKSEEIVKTVPIQKMFEFNKERTLALEWA